MSYDLTLFSIPDGVDPDAAYQQLMQREESEIADIDPGIDRRVKRLLPDSTRATMQQLADAVKTRWPSFIQFQPASPRPWIELNDEALQIQFAIHEDTASITAPYFREPADQMVECIGCCLDACREERGYIAYDPQLGRVVTVADLDRIAQQYRSVDRALPNLRGRAPTTKPWWKFWSRFTS